MGKMPCNNNSSRLIVSRLRSTNLSMKKVSWACATGAPGFCISFLFLFFFLVLLFLHSAIFSSHLAVLPSSHRSTHKTSTTWDDIVSVRQVDAFKIVHAVFVLCEVFMVRFKTWKCLQSDVYDNCVIAANQCILEKVRYVTEDTWMKDFYGFNAL